jgi:hypothetical protein
MVVPLLCNVEVGRGEDILLARAARHQQQQARRHLNQQMIKELIGPNVYICMLLLT